MEASFYLLLPLISSNPFLLFSIDLIPPNSHQRAVPSPQFLPSMKPHPLHYRNPTIPYPTFVSAHSESFPKTTIELEKNNMKAQECSLYLHELQFIFSTAIDGKIKAWLYNNMGSRVDYDAQVIGVLQCFIVLMEVGKKDLGADKSFSCGTSKDGESFLVEWNESEGAIKRTYNEFRKKSTGVVQFDTTQNQFLAAGEDGQIKFWDMDNINLLTSTDAEDKGFKILANANGLRSLRTVETPGFGTLRSPIESAAVKASGSFVVNVSSVNCKVEKSSPVRPSPILV
ncbi:Topless-related protein 3 [Glycine soja]|uniref:Topless-related protein 3 n=1 Tax=Glycine soja TaxID=3848 RepID=A0A445JX82_GLYSO|nr:Topless-related protein 3 [Glycine soja]